MPIKSQSNQGDNDSVLSVVDPVKPKTTYRRSGMGFTLASILLFITGAWLAVNMGILAYLYMHFRVPRILGILLSCSGVCRGLAFVSALRILLQKSLFGPQKSRIAIVAPFLISACGSLLLAWMSNRIIQILFKVMILKVMFLVVLPEFLYTASVLIAELTGRGKYFVAYKREGGNLHEVIDMEKGEKVVVESPDVASNVEDPGKGLWLRDPPSLTVAPFSAPISISVN